MLKQKNDFFNDFKRFENDTFLEGKKKPLYNNINK